ncbi:CDP-glycerol glycerophosphotransferase family protein [Vibrio breoganii]
MYFLITIVACIILNIYFLMLNEKQKKLLLRYHSKIIRNININSFNQHMYCLFYKHLNIKDKYILFESHNGNGIRDNIYSLFKYAASNDQISTSFKFILVTNDLKLIGNEVLNICKNKNVNCKIVKRYSVRYYYYLSVSKFLFNDVTFPQCFVKKEDQRYCNIWHGTPIKAMGKDVKERPLYLQNTQRNFFLSDYLLAPNDVLVDMYKSSYMLGEFAENKLLKTGYPRNDILRDRNLALEVRQKLNYSQHDHIICLMPTWREYDNVLDEDIYVTQLKNYILYLKNKLPSKYKFYVKLHPKATDILSDNEEINSLSIPKDIEINSFLCATDTLITDYSSIMFDYINTESRVILYPHDLDEYIEQRGLNFASYDKLPFVKCFNQESLLSEIISDSALIDSQYAELKLLYGKYECELNCKSIYDKVLFSDKDPIIPNTEKTSILIFSGQLLNNGITTSFKNLVNSIDCDKYEITFCFMGSRVSKRNYDNLYELNSKVDYISIQGRMTLTFIERIRYLFEELIKSDSKSNERFIRNLYNRERRRLFGDKTFDNVIHFTGYDKKPSAMFPTFDSKSTIFVHNDMIREKKTRNNFNDIYLKRAWKNFDNIAVVRESLKSTCEQYLPEIKDKLKLVHNTVDTDTFDEKSRCSIDAEVKDDLILKELNDDSLIKIVTIGRLSPEKGHIRLIKAFEKACVENDKLRLFIIGGHGKSEEDLILKIEQSYVKERIHLVTTVTNPYPILKKMNGFVLSSYYEGLPMVFFEAIMSRVPIVSVDIEGPREFLAKDFGTIVENSDIGLYRGIMLIAENKLKVASIDSLLEFNESALIEFEEIVA